MSRGATFFAGSLRASLPLLLWAAHFAFVYVAVAAGCDARWDEGAIARLSPLRWLLGVASLLALAATALLVRAAYRAAAMANGNVLQARVRLLVAWLALLGIAWSALPLLALPTCHFT